MQMDWLYQYDYLTKARHSVADSQIILWPGSVMRKSTMSATTGRTSRFCENCTGKGGKRAKEPGSEHGPDKIACDDHDSPAGAGQANPKQNLRAMRP